MRASNRRGAASLPGRQGFGLGSSLPRRLLVCALFPACLSCSASPDGEPPLPTVTDDVGYEVALQPEVRTVVSMVPSLTELIVALGEGTRLVARTLEDDAPALHHLPPVGRPATPSVERLLELRPDLVVLWADEGDAAPIAARLRATGIRVYTARVMSFGHLRRHLRVLGAFLGREAAADSVARRLDRALDSAGRAVPDADRPSVAYLIWPVPPAVAGPHTFIDEIIRRAGGTNSFGDLPVPWPTVSVEALLERDPDVVVVPRSGYSAFSGPAIRDAPPLRHLTAVRRGRILTVPPDLFERPGLGNVEAVRLLAEFLHGPAEPEQGADR